MEAKNFVWTFRIHHHEFFFQSPAANPERAILPALVNGFTVPGWSVHMSSANLDYHFNDEIGRAMRAIVRGYRQAFDATSAGKNVQLAGAEKGGQCEKRARVALPGGCYILEDVG